MNLLAAIWRTLTRGCWWIFVMAITFPFVGTISAGAAILVALVRGRTPELVESVRSLPLAVVGSAFLGAATGFLASLIGRVDRSPGAPPDGSSFQLDLFGLGGALLGVVGAAYCGYTEISGTVVLLGFELGSILTWSVAGLFTGAVLGAVLGELMRPSGSRMALEEGDRRQP